MGWYGLSDAEYATVQLFWSEEGEKTLNEVIAFAETKGYVWKQQTAHTVLTHLIEKGVVHARKKGFRRFYSAAMSREAYVSKWLHKMIDENFNGSLATFLTAFAGEEDLQKKNIDELLGYLGAELKQK